MLRSVTQFRLTRSAVETRRNQVRQAFLPDTYRGFARAKHNLLCQHVRLESLTYRKWSTAMKSPETSPSLKTSRFGISGHLAIDPLEENAKNQIAASATSADVVLTIEVNKRSIRSCNKRTRRR